MHGRAARRPVAAAPRRANATAPRQAPTRTSLSRERLVQAVRASRATPTRALSQVRVLLLCVLEHGLKRLAPQSTEGGRLGASVITSTASKPAAAPTQRRREAVRHARDRLRKRAPVGAPVLAPPVAAAAVRVAAVCLSSCCKGSSAFHCSAHYPHCCRRWWRAGRGGRCGMLLPPPQSQTAAGNHEVSAPTFLTV